MFLKVFEIPKNFFQKVLWWSAGVKPLPYKLQFYFNIPFSASISPSTSAAR